MIFPGGAFAGSTVAFGRRCWADRDYTDPVHKGWCHRASETELGLCLPHYEEVFGHRPAIRTYIQNPSA